MDRSRLFLLMANKLMNSINMQQNYFILVFHFFFVSLQDDRSLMSSGDSSDESSGVEVASSSNLHEQILRHQRKQQQKHQEQQQQHQQSQQKQSQQSIQIREGLTKGFGANSNLNNLLHPAALAKLPNEMLLNLVQSGHLQVEEEGAHLPNSMSR